jgi:hypothetical protein
MLFGVLKMPYEMAMRDEISRIQFYQRVQELVAKVETQPEQEPVAWMSQAGNFLSPREFTTADAALYGWTPVYTTPPAAQRPWVGLEAEEILDLFDRNNVYGSKWIEFARTVEAKLKERNGY